MKLLTLTSIALLIFNCSNAQVDQARMNRDLKIAKNIISTLMQEKSDGIMLREHRIEASYIDDFGVIFTLPATSLAPAIDPVTIESISVNKNENIITIKRNGETIERKIRSEISPRSDDREEEEVVVDGGMNTSHSERNDYIRQQFITFLTDYADLIGQLEPEDKIMLKQKSWDRQWFVLPPISAGDPKREFKSSDGLSITALKKDLTQYKSGDIDKEAFVNRLIIDMSKAHKKIADLEIFGNVFKQYFSPEYSKNFFTYEKPSYERIESMGAIYTVQMHTAIVEPDSKPLYGNDQSENSQKKRIKADYNDFVENLKNFMADYGRTIRALGVDEQLILKIKLNTCPFCGLPDSIEASVSVATLMNYDQQKISKDKVINDIMIKEQD